MLVVIAVIGLLATIVLVSLKNAKERASITAALQFEATVHHVLGANAVGIWDFNDGSGVIAKDTSGQGNNGTLTNMPADAWKTDTPSGNGFSLGFDGVDDYVIVNDNDSLDNEYFTITAWVKWNNLINWRRVTEKRSANSKAQYVISVENNQLWSFVHDGVHDIDFDTTQNRPNLTTNRWYHVAITWNGTYLIAYLDGVLYNSAMSTSVSGIVNNDPLRIGTLTAQTFFFNGSIDDIRIYSEAISSAQVEKIYGEGTERHRLSVNK